MPAKRHCPTVRPAPVPSAERLSSSIRMMRSQPINNKSIYNEGRLINTSAATYKSSNNNSVLQNGTFEISSDASHSKNLCIYLYEQKFVTVTGTLNSVNYLQPKNRKAGRKVAQASYAGADGSTILNKLALTE